MHAWNICFHKYLLRRLIKYIDHSPTIPYIVDWLVDLLTVDWWKKGRACFFRMAPSQAQSGRLARWLRIVQHRVVQRKLVNANARSWWWCLPCLAPDSVLVSRSPRSPSSLGAIRNKNTRDPILVKSQRVNEINESTIQGNWSLSLTEHGVVHRNHRKSMQQTRRRSQRSTRDKTWSGKTPEMDTERKIKHKPKLLRGYVV